ncbi:PH domain-containing protein [Nocardioides sp. SOB44]|uniref:PH domain-containing protein n=2 Tax=Nocardioides TaxID=1839 RepID=A0ABT8TP06_9ACTN|nr:PH domain-containing protein [Nocardioides cremeus]MDO3395691.1 PH domain-containing protein [Nocardioides cremeus]
MSEDWQRLDRRMLLVHPVREVLRFMPVLIGVLVFGSTSGGGVGVRWELLGVLVPVALGVLRYLTTAYRVHEGRVELRRGLLQRHLLAARIDRVRTVDTSASLIQRVLDLSTVRIGTGASEQDLDLDGLRAGPARELRAQLLRESAAAPTDELPDPAADTEPEEPPGRPVLRLDPTWSRYAPLTSTGLAIAGALLTALTQLPLPLDAGDLAVAGVAMAVAALLALAVVVSVLAVGGYLVTNWGLTLTHEHGSWHLRRGLTTTRETSVDDARLAGVSIAQPVNLRLAGAARLSSIVTGLQGEGQSQMELVPPAPRAVVVGVAGEVLGDHAPAAATLLPHGPAAVRRRWARALAPALVVAVAAAVLVAQTGLGAWLLGVAALAPAAGALLALDRSRMLGHALLDGRLVAQSGSLTCRRDVLGVEHVIGWNLQDSWFQRRAGLTTLVATTAGGRQRVVVPDVPEGRAVELAAAATPDLLAQFRA